MGAGRALRLGVPRDTMCDIIGCRNINQVHPKLAKKIRQAIRQGETSGTFTTGPEMLQSTAVLADVTCRWERLINYASRVIKTRRSK